MRRLTTVSLLLTTKKREAESPNRVTSHWTSDLHNTESPTSSKHGQNTGDKDAAHIDIGVTFCAALDKTWPKLSLVTQVVHLH